MNQPPKRAIQQALKKAAHAVWYVATALVLPLKRKKYTFKSGRSIPFVRWSKGKFALHAGFYFLLQPLSTFLLPTAEQVLAKRGLDPALVEELAPGKKIYVRDGGFLGRAHEFMALPLLYFFSDARNPKILGRAFPTNRVLGKPAPVVTLYPAREGKGYLELRNELEQIMPPGHRLHMDTVLSAAVQRDLTLLHEIRHCADENMVISDEFACEGDADYHAARVLMAAKKDILDKDVLLMAHVMTRETSLYMAFKMAGAAMPSLEKLKAANATVNEEITSLFIKEAVRNFGICEEDFAQDLSLCAPDTAQRDPLAQQQVDILKRGMQKAFTSVPL